VGTPTFSPDQQGNVNVTYKAGEDPVALVGTVYIVGSDRTINNVITRQLPIYPGQILTYPKPKKAETDVAVLDVFESSTNSPKVTVRVNATNPDNEFKDSLVKVQEWKPGIPIFWGGVDPDSGLMFVEGVNSDSGLTGSIVLNERNFDTLSRRTGCESILNGTWMETWVKDFLLGAWESEMDVR
jgi:outer membrane protein assembly factor BamA